MHDGDFITGQQDDFDPYVREQKRCACGNLIARTSGLETCQRCVDKKWAARDEYDPKRSSGSRRGLTRVVPAWKAVSVNTNGSQAIERSTP